MKSINFLLIVLFSCFFWSCNESVQGNGNVVSESRILNEFSEIKSMGVFEIILEEGEPGIKIEADENLIPYIITSVEGNKLIIHTNDVFLSSDHLKLFVSYQDLEVLNASGAIKLLTKNPINADRFDLDVSGAIDGDLELKVEKLNVEIAGGADLKLRGEAIECSYEISGAAEIQSFELISEEVDIDISGAGQIDVSASDKLTVDISGAADVNYKGSPKVTQSISGAGSISKVND